MHGGAVTLARMFNERDYKPDLILATDMLDVTTFLSLTRKKTSHIPIALYFHENQFAYPWSPDDRDISQKRDKHYGFINYASALAADHVFFNSHYNYDTFVKALRPFLKHFPDYNELATIKAIEQKSSVLPLGLELSRFDAYKSHEKNNVPIILWNHRWEHDKNPHDFFRSLVKLDEMGVDYNLVLLGENFRQIPQEFEGAVARFENRILHYGYAEKFSDYASWLWRADILPVTSNHDFFGISVVEAIYCGCFPLLPNRLAYPELLPENDHSTYFYDNFKELMQKLAASTTAREDTAHLGYFVEKFNHTSTLR